jgi:aspartyl-tRNA(Asn)/glutamyl-tRNA(Gln) amidotransferase subunit A
MCRTVEDAALLLNVVAGYDAADPTTANLPVDDYTRALGAPTARLRVGLPQAAFFDNLDADVGEAVQEALGVLEELTASTTDVVLPATGAPNRVWAPEALAYHSKWLAESPDKYQPGTRQALLNAKTADAAQYVLAVREVEQSRRDIVKTFSAVDVLITPTMKTPAPPLEGGGPPGGGGNNNAVFDIFGLPTISVPCGFSRLGLPIGLSISGAPWAESTVLALAHAYQQSTEWHTRRPALG